MSEQPIIDATPAFERIALAALAEDAVVLCATHRLARDLCREHDHLQMACGLQRWPSLHALTITQWLDARLDEALLAGELYTAPRMQLCAMQESILWDRAIEAVSDTDGSTDAEAFFDRVGMASAAAEANALMVVWNIRPGDGAQNEEFRQFLRWREEFRRICLDAGWLEAARHVDWQIDCLSGGAGRLPQQLVFAGFDRYNPQEQRLAHALKVRGVAVLELEQGLAETAEVRLAELPDRLAECRAAVAWARQRLIERPTARLGIVVPELTALRDTLAGLLDDALDPAALSPARAEMPRHYNFSLGLPLARQSLIAVALQWLDLATHSHDIAQETFGALLRLPGWSADIGEADGRARLDARLRQDMPPTFSLEQFLRFLRKASGKLGAEGSVSRLLSSLEALKTALAEQPSRQPHSAWVPVLRQLLDAIGWPGERVLSSHEFQARRAFDKELNALAELDVVQGRVPLGEACRHLRQLCRERIFQPQTEGEPPVQVMGLLEAAGTPLDELWVMGMNDHLWPPAARPNPLLPAELQRRARSPNASAEVQEEFARTIQRRLLRSAPQVILSWARGEADRALRPSPLLGSVVGLDTGNSNGHSDSFVVPSQRSLLETLVGSVALEQLDDHLAPPLAEGESLRGGTALLRAQALCPAWAFYRYRLGAKALEVTEQVLDEAARGTLLHAVLQGFWQGRGSVELQAMTDESRGAAVALAVDEALQGFNATLELPLSPRLQALEAERLQTLATLWLDFEAQRPQAFRVIACEKEIALEIEGIAVKLKLDRIDELADGRCLILDYKTGSNVSQASWGEARISEPQLPIYAALAQADPEGLAAVAFAKVRIDDCSFIGIGAEEGLLPKVTGIGEAAARRLFPDQSSWDDLLAHWRNSIAAIAREIRTGEAAVSFHDEKDLAWCEVLPLLRLAERRAQIEAGMGRE
jgi:exodeoxyribonuclease-5